MIMKYEFMDQNSKFIIEVIQMALFEFRNPSAHLKTRNHHQFMNFHHQLVLVSTFIEHDLHLIAYLFHNYAY